MNINTISLQNIGLFRRGSTVRRFSAAINFETAKFTMGASTTNANVSTVSISSKARAMLEQSKEKGYEKPNPPVDSNNLKETIFSWSYLEITSDTNCGRLERAIFAEGCTRVSITRVAKEYATMRHELKAEFRGEELKKRLSQLTEDFESVLERIAQHVRSVIITAAFYRGQEGVEDVLYEMFGIRPSLGENFSFDSAVSFADKMFHFVTQMGQLVRQFILEHGTTEGFINHIMNNTNAMNGISSWFSPEDLGLINL